MPLDNLNEFMNALLSPGSDTVTLARARRGIPDNYFGNVGNLYCPPCSEYSGMKLSTLHFEKTVGQELYKELTREDSLGIGAQQKLPQHSDPSLFRLNCVNCNNIFYALIYKSLEKPTLVLFSVKGGGIATQNTPLLVHYYLEQAYKAQAASAYSASLAMYRAALEQLLKDKGFSGKLPVMLAKLNQQVADGSAPAWTRRLNVDCLSIIKDICNSHVHPSELSKLQSVTSAFMSNVQRTFYLLLNSAYEQEPRQAAAKAKLTAALQKAKKSKTE